MKTDYKISPKLSTILNKMKVNKDGYLRHHSEKHYRLMTRDHSPVLNIDLELINTLILCKYIELTYQSNGIFTFNFINN